MLSDLHIHLIAKALTWLLVLVSSALILVAASLVSFDYIGSEDAAVRRNELESVENDTLPITTVKTIPSLAALLAKPGKYHDQRVWVKGYLNLEFEGDMFYINRAAYTGHKYENGCYVQVSDSLMRKKRVDDYSKRYVAIRGLFNNMEGRHGRLIIEDIKTLPHLTALRRPTK